MNLEQIEARLVEACEWAVANGWKLKGNGEFGDAESRTCCALGAFNAQVDGQPENLKRIYDVLGLDDDQYESIGDGFDGTLSRLRTDPDLYAMGTRLRARFLLK